MNVVEILADFMKILASPGGAAVLERFFSDHGITPATTAAAVKQMPIASDPKE